MDRPPSTDGGDLMCAHNPQEGLHQWWGIRQPDGGYYYNAAGHLGQRIAVSPDDEVIIVRFGFDEEGVDSWDEVIAKV
jgi:hypothetical protein